MDTSENFLQVASNTDGHYAVALMENDLILQWEFNHKSTDVNLDDAMVVTTLQQQKVVKLDAGDGYL